MVKQESQRKLLQVMSSMMVHCLTMYNTAIFIIIEVQKVSAGTAILTIIEGHETDCNVIYDGSLFNDV